MRDKRTWLPAHDAYVRTHADMSASEIGAAIDQYGTTVTRHAQMLGVKLPNGRTGPRGPRIAATSWHFAALYDWARARNRSLSA